ncbi:MAG: hypothetical protein GC164_00055 [Phycisphaera sp.]|nr:hypothetical protein [Phycisphaera sp.]
MIRETNAFLNWALEENRDLPRIPRRRVEDGGFVLLMRRDGARAMVDRWWGWMLNSQAFEGVRNRLPF